MNKSELTQWVSERRNIFDDDDNPFGCSAWMQHYISQVARDDWTYYADEEALLLLYSTPQRPHEMRALGNYYTCLFKAQVPPQTPIDAATLNIAPLDEAAADDLATALRLRGFYVRKYFASANHYMPCSGLSFDAYMAARPSQIVNTWKRKAKKFPGRIEIVTGEDGDQLERGIEAYELIYSKSWKQPEPYPTFVADWMRICARNGWLRLGIAWLDEETPVAAQFWFTREQRAYIYKLAYDEAHGKLSAGTLLTVELMRHALEVDRAVEIDYLSGDDDYKATWVTHRRERVGLMCCNLSTARGIMAALRECAGTAARSLKGLRKQKPSARPAVPARETRSGEIVVARLETE